ncbi:MAG: PspC domain-containing protein [Gammaproteobacteria bacterium]|nr:PspC domain-containing protein [Gammaproteobacteria bacterium]
MTAHATTSISRFTRDTDRALLAGVCAGFADHFGFNLRVTRLLLIIAFFFAMPITVITYVLIVLLVPATSHGGSQVETQRRACRRRRRMSRKERRLAEEEARVEASDEFARRCRSLDERLAQIEKYVTSSRYSLDREFRNL